MLAAIAWFILSIEFTLRWNDIRGVHSINNTGQLIPFVIGCVNASQVIKKAMLLVLAKVNIRCILIFIDDAKFNDMQIDLP